MLKKSNKFSFRFKFPEFLLLILIITSGVSLAFSSGSFIISLKTVGFSILSTAQRGIESVATGVSNTFGAVKELSRLKKDYDELTIKLEKYEQMRRSNVDIKKDGINEFKHIDLSYDEIFDLINRLQAENERLQNTFDDVLDRERVKGGADNG